MAEWDYEGNSALTLLSVWTGVEKVNPSIPYDPSDWARCREMCEAFGLHMKNLIKKASKKYPEWAGFYHRYDELEALWKEEQASNHCPKLYALMLEIRKIEEN